MTLAEHARAESVRIFGSTFLEFSPGMGQSFLHFSVPDQVATLFSKSADNGMIAPAGSCPFGVFFPDSTSTVWVGTRMSPKVMPDAAFLSPAVIPTRIAKRAFCQ